MLLRHTWARCPKAQTATLPRATGRGFFYGLAQHALGKKARRVYYEAVREDRRLIRRKVFFLQNLYKQASAEREASEIRDMAELCFPIADVAINDDGLPTPTDTLSSQVVGWSKHGSLSICTQCHSVQARRLEPSDLRRTAPALMSPKVCAAGRHQEYAPQPEDIPVALQRLRPRVLAALRLLDVDTGVYQRASHGYRVHTAMVRFRWASTSVDNNILALPKKKDRRRATKALRHLLT